MLAEAGLVWVHAAVNVGHGLYQIRGRRRRSEALAAWSGRVLPPLNAVAAALATLVLAADVRAGRDPLPGAVPAAWTPVPRALTFAPILRRRA